jgi:DNA-binding transcriptional MocR family regulator/CheY-like chemotaxis protein
LRLVAPTASRPRILVVDDDATARHALRLALDQHHEVVEASDGETALALLEGHRADIIVLDLQWPTAGGLQVLEHARTRPRRIPVIVISGVKTPWTAATAMRLGAVHYLTKPFDDTQLLSAVADGLEFRDQRASHRKLPRRRPVTLFVGVPVGVRATLSVVFRELCRVEVVRDVPAAVTRLKAVSPDMIVIQMPEGTERVHLAPVSRLRREFPDGPIIAIAAGDEVRVTASDPPGPLALLRKPVSVSALLHEIEASLPRRVARSPRLTGSMLRILDCLAEHYADATIEFLGKTMGMAPSYLSTCFRQEMGTQLRTYLRTLRLEIAKMLLVETSDSIEAIATRVGLQGASHLSRLFIADLGCRPGVYRRDERGPRPETVRTSDDAARVLAGHPWSSLVDPPVLAVNPFSTPMIRVTAEERVAFDLAECIGELRPPQFLNAMVTEAMRDPEALGYAPLGAPLPAFGDAVGAYLAERGVSAADSAVLTTSGTSTSLAVLVRAFAAPGDIVAVEQPTWHVALAVFAAAGLRVLGIPVDDEGLRVDLLAAALRRHDVRLTYVQPAFQNPTGVSLSPRRRTELLEVARQSDTLIVEDDFAAELAYDQVPPPLRTVEAADQVVYLKSFSKLLMPALRAGIMVAPRRYERALQESQHGLDPFPSALAQSVVARCLPMPEFRQHVQRVRALLDARSQALSGALHTRMPDGVRWTVPRGGLCAWMEIPAPLTTLELLVDVAEGGVGFAPGPVFCLDGSGQRGARLAFGATPPSAIERGVRHLARALRERLRDPSRSPLVGATAAP